MPELPEVETVCRTLSGTIVGNGLETAHVLWGRTVEPTDPTDFAYRVAGSNVLEITRRAKLIVMRLSTGDVLTTHLRMTGKLLYSAPATPPLEEPERHLRVAFELSDGGRLDFFDARKFGRMSLLTPAEWHEVSSNFGPEPLEAEFTPELFYEGLKSTRRQIKPLLLDQRFLAGVGNIYADEALFQARIHPQKPANSTSRRKAGLLHGAIVETLDSAVRNAGTTLRDYRSGTGDQGSNQHHLKVYGRPQGSSCVRCGTKLKRLVVGQRGTTICPRCQRLR